MQNLRCFEGSVFIRQPPSGRQQFHSLAGNYRERTRPASSVSLITAEMGTPKTWPQMQRWHTATSSWHELAVSRAKIQVQVQVAWLASGSARRREEIRDCHWQSMKQEASRATGGCRCRRRRHRAAFEFSSCAAPSCNCKRNAATGRQLATTKIDD